MRLGYITWFTDIANVDCTKCSLFNNKEATSEDKPADPESDSQVGNLTRMTTMS